MEIVIDWKGIIAFIVFGFLTVLNIIYFVLIGLDEFNKWRNK